MNLKVRRAVGKDIPKILDLLVQVDMVHHNGRPDIFKGPATKYSAGQLEKIISDSSTPVFVCVDSKKLCANGKFLTTEIYKNGKVK